MISISMCMIAKNEESVLKRCLDSYSGLFDEIIIVDTGSTDNTKNIAAGYTDKIYDFEWTGDFSEARNFAFSKASCDYIFSADADEVLDDYNRNLFMRLKSVLLPEIDIVQMKYVNCSHNTVYNSKKELRPKLYKRLRTFTWISPIHETVRLQPVIFDSDIEILHMPQSSHSKRDFSIFKKLIMEHILKTMFLECFAKNCSYQEAMMTLKNFMIYLPDDSYTNIQTMTVLKQYHASLPECTVLKILAMIFLRLHLKMLLYHHVLKSVWKLAIIFSIKTTYLRLSYGISMPAVKQRAFLT